MKHRKIIRVGTRDSQLALWQAHSLIDKLSKHTDSSFKIVTLKSTGDQISDVPFNKIEGKGFFTKELDQALLTNVCDMAVHSLKDIPTEFSSELQIAAITKRHDPRDVLIGRQSLDQLSEGASIATGSLRRKSQILVYRPDLKIVGLRGNLQTRYEKFENSYWDGMILAGAGVDRLKMSNTISERIDTKKMVPAVGQGSLGVIIRKSDDDMRLLLECIDDKEARIASLAERSFLAFLAGGCTTPIACYCKVEGNKIYLDAFVGDLNGKRYLREKDTGHYQQSKKIGLNLAEKMTKLGAKEILNKSS